MRNLSKINFKQIKVYAYFLLLINIPCAYSINFSKVNEKKAIESYYKAFDQFNKKLCKAGTESKFREKYRDYKGSNLYIPKIFGELDQKTIANNIDIINEKIIWLEETLVWVKRNDTRDKVEKIIYKINDFLVEINKHLEVNKSDSNLIHDYAVELSVLYSNLIEKIPFYLNVKFPVNHLRLRQNYDYLLNKKNKKGLRNKNNIYFLRRILEDGAQNSNHTRSDRMFRSLVSMLYIRLKEQLKKNNTIEFINIIYDMNYVSKYIYKNYVLKKQDLEERFQEWLWRTKSNLKFYQDILSKKKFRNKFLKKKIQTNNALQKYVLEKKIETFKFWKDQNEVSRALYVLETILMNEVGHLDKDKLERLDVIQVVLNRLNISRYNKISKKRSLGKNLIRNGIKNYPQYRWLSVLFKEGEFSFTYYFIFSSLRFFCPDMSFMARNLRAENIFLILDYLRRKPSKFRAVQYFSRQSMLGRIDMTKIWKSKPINERRGRLIESEAREKFTSLISRNNYQYIYELSSLGKVIKLFSGEKSISLVFNPIDEVENFYQYRNPNYFKYFDP